MANTQAQNKPRIGFIGMGHMGSLMAERLLHAGYPVTVYDRTPDKAQALMRHGAQIADQPRTLASNCQIVMLCVTDAHAVNELTDGPEGALAGLKNGSTLIDLSTVSPEKSRHLYEAAHTKGARMIDAAVSGSTPQVQEGSLVIFVGGDQDVYQQCKPLLEVLGKSVIYMGTSGMGTTMKLVVNALLGLGLQAVAEAITLGEKAGLDKRQLIEVLGQTAVIAPTHKQKLQNALNDDYPVEFALSLMRKDFSLIMHQAAELSVSMPATAAAEQLYAAALAQGHDEDYSVMIQFMQQLSGIKQESYASRH
ncbi:MAG TPA: NAD(P)-dependent oxidoreductase [Ktedonobacteraceae bacterium]|jgi:3-hydroxyisobutyrate dehydrogenase-like beta-hydroxyacid dehydrogenase|nr:NAD(P)-dependent oxidoreductase [Ktedonobacteraceae bacterium]